MNLFRDSLGIQHFGWRTSAFLCGLVVLGILLPCSLVFRRSPESIGLLPDGDTERIRVGTEPAGISAPGKVDFSVGEALRTTSFWVLTLAICLRMSAFVCVTVHFVPIAVWKGTDKPTGALLLGMLALFSIPLRILLGWITDRLPRSRVIEVGWV